MNKIQKSIHINLVFSYGYKIVILFHRLIKGKGKFNNLNSFHNQFQDGNYIVDSLKNASLQPKIIEDLLSAGHYSSGLFSIRIEMI